MSIEDAGHARFGAHEKALEDHLATSMKSSSGSALVRHVFRVVAAPTLSGGTTNEHWMARPAAFESIVAEGSKHIDEVLRGEDRGLLIDALADKTLEERPLAHSWARAVAGERPGGGVATEPLNSVLLAFRTLSNTALASMREHGVKVVYPNSEIRTYALKHPTRPAVGYVLDPNPDDVVLRVKSDWKMMRSTTARTAELVLESISKIDIGDGTTVVRIVG